MIIDITPPQNDPPPGYAYSIATLVNDDAQLDAMRQSFRMHGFGGTDVEFLAARRATSAFTALNAMIDRARGDIVILCHQDVRLVDDGRAELEARLAELARLDPAWALAGNAGGEAAGRLAIRISDPHGSDRRVGELPARVMSLDENFLVLRRNSGARFSRNLDGFHLYGADICLVADVLGWSAWVIDFHLRHLSPGRKDASFVEAEHRFRAKWSRALRPRWMQTPCTLLRISGGAGGRSLARLGEGAVRRIARRLPRAAGWTQPPATSG
ncbi:MAG: hypothetical protein SFW09_07840 [Hyphomicrobiaceae bacterium]|nr:hypothetical protein [Hyphomicrobiaceae bacterium]